MSRVDKCDDHSGVCQFMDNVTDEQKRQWEAINSINNRLWQILVGIVLTAGATVVNLIISLSNGKGSP